MPKRNEKQKEILADLKGESFHCTFGAGTYVYTLENRWKDSYFGF